MIFLTLQAGDAFWLIPTQNTYDQIYSIENYSQDWEFHGQSSGRIQKIAIFPLGFLYKHQDSKSEFETRGFRLTSLVPDTCMYTW